MAILVITRWYTISEKPFHIPDYHITRWYTTILHGYHIYIYIHIVPDIINIYPRYILRTYYTPYHITPRYVYVLSGGGRQLLLRRHHGSTLRGGGSPGGARTEYVRYTVGKTIEKWENPRKTVGKPWENHLRLHDELERSTMGQFP